MISPQHSKQKYNTSYKGAAARELLIIKTILELPFYQQEKPKTVPGTCNMQHVSILRNQTYLGSNNFEKPFSIPWFTLRNFVWLATTPTKKFALVCVYLNLRGGIP